MALLSVQNLSKVYSSRLGGNQVTALSDVTFSVECGEYVAIMGESGSGKTTLLNILAALDKPTNGTVDLDGKLLSNISEKEIAAFRRDNLGFVFQEFNLLDTFSLKDNIFLQKKVMKKWKIVLPLLRPNSALKIFWKNILMKFRAGKSNAPLSHGRS